MEGSCLTFSTALAPARPSTCLHYNSTFVKQFQTNTITPRRGLSVKASTHKPTLSTNWDVSSYSKAPAWMPRFEELDTTNMLLRQRIIFLGSQVRTNLIKIWGFLIQLSFLLVPYSILLSLISVRLPLFW